MKSINNKAVRNLVQSGLESMIQASSTDGIKQAYASLQSSLKEYYDTCLAVAEYNELIAMFDTPQ